MGGGGSFGFNHGRTPWILIRGSSSAAIEIEAIEALIPEAAVLVDPAGNVFEGAGFEAARAPPGGATTDDQAGLFQYSEVLRDRRHAHFKWLSQFGDRRFTKCEPSQDGTARGIGESGECGSKLICHSNKPIQ
jgi:hypothetical protein